VTLCRPDGRRCDVLRPIYAHSVTERLRSLAEAFDRAATREEGRPDRVTILENPVSSAAEKPEPQYMVIEVKGWRPGEILVETRTRSLSFAAEGSTFGSGTRFARTANTNTRSRTKAGGIVRLSADCFTRRRARCANTSGRRCRRARRVGGPRESSTSI
jgi:hypothetical protein